MSNTQELREELADRFARMIRAQHVTAKQTPILDFEVRRLARMLNKSFDATVKLVSDDAMKLINA